MKCKICSKEYAKLSSFIQHIIKGHNILFYDYCLEYDDSLIRCQYCKNIVDRGCSYSFCGSKHCRSFKMRLSRYPSVNDIFNIYDPLYWISFYDNDIIKTNEKLSYLKNFDVFLKSDQYLKLFKSENLECDFFQFIDRIKDGLINIEDLKKYKNMNSIGRYNVLGFSEDVFKILNPYFTTNKESYIDRHGKNKWEQYSSKLGSTQVISCWQTKYWINKGYSYEDAKKLISKNASRDINYFINKYGKEKGKQSYQNMIEKRKFSFSLEGYCKKYGSDGFKKYHECIKKKTSWVPNIQSKVSLDCISELYTLLPNNIKCIYEEPIEFYVCDFYFPELKCVIEFYGDYWHQNPLISNIGDRYHIEKCHDNHKRRSECLLNSGRVDKIIIVWELAYTKSKTECLLNILKCFKLHHKYNELNFQNGNILYNKELI